MYGISVQECDQNEDCSIKSFAKNVETITWVIIVTEKSADDFRTMTTASFTTRAARRLRREK